MVAEVRKREPASFCGFRTGYPADAAAVCRLPSGGDPFGRNADTFRDSHAAPFGILIICAARYAAHRWPVEHGPSHRKLLCDFGDAAPKELRAADVRGWRSDVAALIHVRLAGHAERVAVAVQDVLVGVGAGVPVIQTEIDPRHLVRSRERHQLDQRILLVAAAGRAVGEPAAIFPAQRFSTY